MKTRSTLKLALLGLMAGGVILGPTTAWAFRYVNLKSDDYHMPFEDETDTSMKPLNGMTQSSGAQSCWAAGGAYMASANGQTGCWAESLPATLKPSAIRTEWPSIPEDPAAKTKALAKCLRRDVISIAVVRGQIMCIDTPAAVLRDAAKAYGDGGRVGDYRPKN